MVRLPPAEKLPLAVRKDIRDNWENKRADHEKAISEVLGESWTVDINPNAIWPYGENWAKDCTGEMIARYIEAARDRLVEFIRKCGEEGKDEINAVCSEHVIGMDVDEHKQVVYNGCKVADGKLIILFAPGMLGTNIDDPLQADKLSEAINSAGTSGGLTFEERQGISNVSDELAEVKERINKILAREIAIEPGFDAISAKLAGSKQVMETWRGQMGRFVMSYYAALASWLKGQNFGDDDMLQEGMNEALSSGTIKFRVVDALRPENRYNQCTFEDGTLFLETTPEAFGVNIDQVGNNIIDLL